MVFLEFTALTLPTLIRTVMPMAVFAAAVYVTNRLTRESELTVMLATGSSPWRLGRAVFLFGVVAGVMMAIISVFLRPASVDQLERRESEVAADVTAQFADVENVPVPPHWGGYLIAPEVVEFWQGRENRVHNRIRLQNGIIERLQP